ncbi:MAG TPA: hypothetical protein PKY59_16145 [Pyrinomonadaceae bacterium]|nr:hypothetical protein [Pyrinomonadaceae bacterium]
MRVCLRLLTIAVFLSLGISYISAQEIGKVPTGTAQVFSNNGGDDKNKKSDKKDESAKTNEPATGEIKDPLVTLLVKKGLINEAEGKSIGGGTPAEQRDRLANLLLQKGLISVAELDAIRVIQPPANTEAANVSSLKANETAVKTAAAPVNANSVAAQTAPAVIPAITPLRVLQLEGAKRDGLIPDLKLGSGAKVKLYGFYKTSLVWDSSNPPGNDFPLPGFLNDSGPNGSPEFHLKTRAFRFGANFEWLDPSPKLTVTGKVEVDFEGDFTRSNNRNISSIRSSQPSLRLAWVRIDKSFDDKKSAFVLFGQDWTPFGSSTVPNTIETTGFHLAYGNIYERAPQIRTGANFLLSKNRNVRFQPEFAIVLPFFGNTPSNPADQLGLGERQGVDSNRPEFQGRFVLQFQLDKAAGVAPAQLITSWTEGKRRAVVARGNVPTAFLPFFPNGAEVESERYGYTGEFQLPTRWFTLIGKYYNGADLRAYFGGQLFSNFSDTAGLTGTATATSLDGSSNVVFGFNGTQAVVAPQRPVRGQGGFINLGLPLSRWFHADPKGRNAGWTAYLNYGYDEAFARDARRLGAGRGKGDVFMSNLQYKMNSFITFAYEVSYFRTRASNQAGALPLFRGIPSRETHNIRSEFATIFNF